MAREHFPFTGGCYWAANVRYELPNMWNYFIRRCADVTSDLNFPFHRYLSSVHHVRAEVLYSAVYSHKECSKRFTLFSLANLFNQTPFRLLWEVPSHVVINTRRLFVHKYPPLLTIGRYPFIQLSDLEQCKACLTQQHRMFLVPCSTHWATALMRPYCLDTEHGVI